ncbi:MAG: PEP-utilizing enzyme [Candidatus Diapherotrites archaeon]
MKGEWFEWERESTIHPLFIPLEAAMKPLRDYFGTSWPDSILVYRGNIVLWCGKNESLQSLGKKMLEFYLVEKNKNQLLKDIENATQKLKLVSGKIEATNLNALGNNELLPLYSELRLDYIDWYKLGWTTEPIGLHGEQLIKKIVEGQKQKVFSILTSTTRKSFSRRAEEELLEIAENKKSGEDISKGIEEYSANYYWLHNSYFKTAVLGKAFFEKELDSMLKEHPNPKQYLQELAVLSENQAKEKQRTIKELGLEAHRNLIELLDLFAWLQDFRKEHIMRTCHFLDLLLGEIGKRAGFSLWEMKYTLPNDLPLVLEGRFEKKEIAARQKNCIIIWKEFSDNYELFTGEEAIAKEKTIFVEKEKTIEIVEIDGMSASQGRVKGEAFVSMSAEEAKGMKAGQILVTSMTSPDFVIAIKKAAAIVTNEGGITSHAAIIAREFGVPCVVGTKIATKALKTGDYIEVDGIHGKVRKLTARAE